ncbi:MAG: PIN domain-containing protein [Candidatus Gracilibacteria bacterium]
MVILDTSFLIAFFRTNDVHHAAAIDAAETYREKTKIVSFLVFQEFVSILNRKVSTEFASTLSRLLLSGENNLEIYKLDEANLENVLKLYGELGPHTFSYVDVSLIHLSKELELPVLTFDKDLAEALA